MHLPTILYYCALIGGFIAFLEFSLKVVGNVIGLVAAFYTWRNLNK